MQPRGWRKSTVFAAFLAAELLVAGALGAHGGLTRTRSQPAIERKRQLVAKFQLTDLCFFPEARYTRHPSQADGNTPFQDHPISLEHFPSGSLVCPPGHLVLPGAGEDPGDRQTDSL